MRATVLHALLALAGAAAAQERPAPLGEAATATVVYNFEQAEHWAMRAIVLLTLGDDYHPAAAAILVAALRDRDVRLAAFGVEQVLRTGDRVAAAVAVPPLIDALVELLPTKNEHLRARTLQALARLLPASGATDAAAWRRWWSEHKAAHAAAPWTPVAAAPQAAGTVTQRIVERAFDLRDAGLEVVFVLDSTGSMQLAIDAARDAIDEVATILAGVTPRLRLGLVHYKDFGDMSNAARLLVPLTKDYRKVRERLDKLQAGGGGDIPERIEKGVEVALDPATGWSKGSNRMLLVIGDAPPHPEAEQYLLELVRRAYEHPDARGKGPVTGARKEGVRPFITSTIATNASVKGIFEQIAAAGGGTSVVLDLAAQRRTVDGKPVGRQRTAGQRIAEHVLLLSFGAGFEAQLRVFVDVFFEYRNAGLF